MAIFSQNRLQVLENDKLALLLTTPIPTIRLPKKQIRQNRPRPKERIKVEATLQPIIPQKRQKTFEEREEIYQFQARPGSPILSLPTRTSPSVVPATPIGNMQYKSNAEDIKAII